MSPKPLLKKKVPNPDPPATITLGGQAIILHDLNVGEGIELCLLIGPYLPGIVTALQELSTTAPSEIKTRILRALVKDARHFPGDLMKMIGVFARRRPKWIAENATGTEALVALGVILERVEFEEILRMGSRLGLIGERSQDGRRRTS